ncbi:hypothetical protein Hdeb2414_s0053g00753681 [Helianthus debilis subsp. tardiflorus]
MYICIKWKKQIQVSYNTISTVFLSRYQHDSLSSSLKLPSICLRFAAVSSRQSPCSEITGHLFINPEEGTRAAEEEPTSLGKLLQERKSLMRDEGISLMMDQSSSDHLVYSYLKDAMETVQEKMEKSEKELDKIFKSK